MSLNPAEAVSDHALLRWLERVHHVDVEGYRAALCQEIASALQLGALSHRTEQCTYIFRGGRLVTVLAPEMKQVKPYSRRKHIRPPGMKERLH